MTRSPSDPFFSPLDVFHIEGEDGSAPTITERVLVLVLPQVAIGGLGYGYGYGYPAYAYNGYYGGDCWVQHRIVYRYGRRVVVPVQVCG